MAGRLAIFLDVVNNCRCDNVHGVWDVQRAPGHGRLVHADCCWYWSPLNLHSAGMLSSECLWIMNESANRQALITELAIEHQPAARKAGLECLIVLPAVVLMSKYTNAGCLPSRNAERSFVKQPAGAGGGGGGGGGGNPTLRAGLETEQLFQETACWGE